MGRVDCVMLASVEALVAVLAMTGTIGATVGGLMAWLGRVKLAADAPLRAIAQVGHEEDARVIGRVVEIPEPLRAPASGRACAAFEVVMRENSMLTRGTRTLTHERACTTFVIDDGTGRARVVTPTATVLLHDDRFFRVGPREEMTPQLEAFLAPHLPSPTAQVAFPTWVEEGALELGETVEIIGRAQRVDGEIRFAGEHLLVSDQRSRDKAIGAAYWALRATPTTPLTSATLGSTVKLVGVARAAQATQRAPLTERECIAFDLVCSHRRKGSLATELDEAAALVPFVLECDVGAVWIDTTTAVRALFRRDETHQSYGVVLGNNFPAAVARLFTERGVLAPGELPDAFSVREGVLEVGERVAVRGRLVAAPDGAPPGIRFALVPPPGDHVLLSDEPATQQ